MPRRCAACGKSFPIHVVIDGVRHNLGSRHFCLECSPFGLHNTSKRPVGAREGAEADAFRRRSMLRELAFSITGPWCRDCGTADKTVLGFHHVDPATKEFDVSAFLGSTDRLRREAEKCIVLCATCHALRHATEDAGLSAARLRRRRDQKTRAVDLFGGMCADCGGVFPQAVFQFHHLDGTTKEFGVGQDGVVHDWPRLEAELRKCVMLCANCHRRRHAAGGNVDAA